MGDSIKVEQHKEEGGIWTLIISNQDKRNALTPNILNGISEFLEDPEIRESARVMVIRGEGDRAFSAGYDISQIRAVPGSDGSQASGEILMRSIRNIKKHRISSACCHIKHQMYKFISNYKVAIYELVS